MNAQIVLGKVTAAAAYFIYLLERLLDSGHAGNALNTRADATAIRFGPNRPHFDPVIARSRVAAEELWNVIYAIDDNINIAIIIEIAKGAAASRSGRVDAWTTFG